MAENTNIHLRNQVMYSVYVRNHTEEGTFKAVENDLERIKKLGTDIIWLMPIHPIGEKGKKGSLGCPYSIKDYRDVNPNYGTMPDFVSLVDKIHSMGMKCIIDVVYNHTSPDSKLSKAHPEFFYKKEDGSFGNHIGDWSDVIDLDYTNKDLWDYQIETLKQWAKIVDGFRCDVASLVPAEFWRRARKECAEVKENLIWLAESIHVDFLKYARSIGCKAWTDSELYTAFDITYDYDIWDEYEGYLNNKVLLSEYVGYLNFQDGIYPENYVKLRCLENHDRNRIASYFKDEDIIKNYTAFIYFQKGTAFVYAGEEFENDFTPSLFEVDTIKRDTGKDISQYLKKLYDIKKLPIMADGAYKIVADNDADSVEIIYEKGDEKLVGAFSLKGKISEMHIDIPDGKYVNLIDENTVTITNGMISTTVMPVIIK